MTDYGTTCDCCGFKTQKPKGPQGRLCGACRPNVCEECGSYVPDQGHTAGCPKDSLEFSRVPCFGEDS
jgi:hypothetical protein